MDQKNVEEQEPAKPPPKKNFWLGLMFGVISHACFGMHPIFSRYLQHATSNPFPPLLLIGSMNFISLLLYSPRIFFKLIKQLLQANKKHHTAKEKLYALWQFFKVEILQNWILWFFSINLLLRSVTNILSSKYAQAIYVQLLALSVPFLVTIFCTMLSKLHSLYMRKVRKEQQFDILFEDEIINWKTLIAIIVSCVGGVLIILGGVGKTERWYDFLFSFQFHNLAGAEISWSDVVGMILSMVSSAALAIYMIQLRFMKTRKTKLENPVINFNNGEDVYIVQLLVLSSLLIPSAIFEPWTVFLHMNVMDWAMYLCFTFLIFFLANGFNIFAIQNLGATTAGSMLPLRLVATIIVGSIILQEYLKSIWPLVGAITVIGGISFFMYCKHVDSKAKSKQEQRKIPRDVSHDVIDVPVEEVPATYIEMERIEEKQEFLGAKEDTKKEIHTPIE